jgi:hypothetical protein
MWLDSLTPARRAQVLAAMREIGALAETQRNKARERSARHDTVGVGRADFEYNIRAEGAESYLRFLRQGATPDGAHAGAVSAMAAIVREQNAKHKDYVTAYSDTEGHAWLRANVHDRMSSEARRRAKIHKWHDHVADLRSELDEVRQSRDEAEQELEALDTALADALYVVKDWMHDVLVLGKPMRDPRAVLRTVERALEP